VHFETDAIVIRKAPFSESSQIVHLLTAREGRISALARGTYRPKSSFGGALDLATRGRAHIVRRKNSELDILQCFTIQRSYRGVRRRRVRWVACCYLLELVRSFSWQRDPETDLYRLLDTVLEALDSETDRLAVETWLAFFVVRLLDNAGFRPAVSACVNCRQALAGSGLRFSIARGGVLCGDCVSADRSAPVCSNAALEVHRRLQNGAGPVNSETRTVAALAEVRRHLDACVEYRLERPLLTSRLLRRE
jgi:DNA repair protein RecO (recombination protein O)